jgi:hypothetical protein
MNSVFKWAATILLLVSVAACGNSNSNPGGDNKAYLSGEEERESTIWDIFENSSDPNTKIEVNKYLWNASLEILDFLPVQEVDPFSGIFITGYGTPPGGSRSYRAAVYIQDPALDARSLNVSLQTSNGRAVSAETQRAIEDAILTRARQLRLRDGKL